MPTNIWDRGISPRGLGRLTTRCISFGWHSSPDKNGNAWECGTWDVPVLDGDTRFDRPAITEGLVSYGNKVEMAENGANGDESSQVLDK